MKIERIEKSLVRKILIGMIVDTDVLGRIADKWEDKGLFKDNWPNLIGGWAVKYYNKYGRAPKQHIEGYFGRWAERHEDPTLVKLVEKFMGAISGEYARLKKDVNANYILDQALEHFNAVRLEKLVDSLQHGLETGKIDEAYKRAHGFGKLETGMQKMIRPFEDRAVVKQAFAERREPLFKFQGKGLKALNNFYEDIFSRDSFVAYMGPEKRGKTWWLIETAYQAMLAGRKVAFFEIGDMSQNQIERRLMVRASGRPWKPKTLQVPIDIETPDGDSMPEITYKQRRFKRFLLRKRAWAASQKVVKQYGSDLFRLWVYPNSTLSVAGLQAEVKVAERQGWVPDVLVIDYADLFASMPGYANDSQDQIDVAWRAMRSISQQYHCCVITATQSDAASYYVDTLDKSHFSRDKRKFAHATAVVGLNQTKDEKKAGVYRLNQLVVRESEYEEEKCVYVAGCLGLANPAMHSTF